MGQTIECDHAGCGRIGDDEAGGAWFRLTVHGPEGTTFWYCSPYCLLLDTVLFDAESLSRENVLHLQSALASVVGETPRALPSPVSAA